MPFFGWNVSRYADCLRGGHLSSSFLWILLVLQVTPLLELCSDFGIEESGGTLLRVSFSHKDIASLAGASRPRVTEHLARLEREEFVARRGRQLIVQIAKLNDVNAS